MSEILNLDWSNYFKYINNLIHLIKKNKLEDWPILAIARGGLIPATLISHALHNPDLQVIGMTSYEGKLQKKIIMTQEPKIDSNRYLIIDDLVDSGKTLNLVKYYLQEETCCVETKVAVLIDKYSINHTITNRPRADLFVTSIHPDVWIEFPYEVDDDKT